MNITVIFVMLKFLIDADCRCTVCDYVGYALMSNGSLRIESVDLRDAGLYVCIAQNSAGTALSQKRLEVQGIYPLKDRQR